MKYEIIQAKDFESFTQKLEIKIKDGWRPYGDIMDRNGIGCINLCLIKDNEFHEKKKIKVIVIEGKETEIESFNKSVYLKLEEGFKLLFPPIWECGIVRQFFIKEI